MSLAPNTPAKTQKTGVLLLNMGGPDSLEAVEPFLYNLFSDPDILKLPLSSLLQKPLARFIVARRGKEAQKNYAKMGGLSPILPHTEAQAKALQERLQQAGEDVQVYIAMRYWHPLSDATLAAIRQDGIERLIVVPLYPHFSYTTTGSSLNDLKRALQRQDVALPTSIIPYYYHRTDYQAALADTIREGLARHPWSCPSERVQILFSAHSLPLSHVKKTQDPYPEHIYETARQVMETHFPQHAWDICYQSQVGKFPWLGPSVDGVLHYYSAQQVENILVVPVSFVCDHIETLVEIDIQYAELAQELGIPHFHRAPALNSHPLFIETLATLVRERLTDFEGAPETEPNLGVQTLLATLAS